MPRAHESEGGRAKETAWRSASSTFAPIADFGLLSDCTNSCLITSTGAVEWLCLPRPDDPSVFGAILDRGAGSFRVTPVGDWAPVQRHYVPGTMILATTWRGEEGELLVEDFLAVGPSDRPRQAAAARRGPMFAPRHSLVRSITCLRGHAEVSIECEPRFDYGRAGAAWEYAGSSRDEVLTRGPDVARLSLSGDLDFVIDAGVARARRRLSAGQTAFVTLGWGEGVPFTSRAHVESCLEETSRAWRDWVGEGVFPDHRWRDHLVRSALTLKSMTYAPTGAILAAPTTSLPEEIGGERNWDYRYTWIRDAALSLQSLRALGFHDETDDFLLFLSDVLEPTGGSGDTEVAVVRPLQILYGLDGAQSVAESELDHLTGYADSRPVRIGNGAYDQVQHDVLGALVDCIFEHARARDSLDERWWRVAAHAVQIAVASWRDVDRGIWEMRGEPQHFTFSKVMCWVALDRGARLAAMRGDESRAVAWRDVADEILSEVCSRSLTAQGCFAQSYGSEELDASLLLLPVLGFLPANDERVRATVLAIARDLGEGPFVFRYHARSTDDGLGGEPEGTFSPCSFWLVSALVAIGEVQKARVHLEELLSAGSALGLYAEEIDAATLDHLGNFPQAFTHLALINAVRDVIAAEGVG